MHSYVVTRKIGDGEVNRMIRVKQKHELLVQAKMAFGVTGDYGLDVFNEEYGLYLRLDDMNEMPDGGRLLLVELPPSSVSAANTSGAVPILSLQPTMPVTEIQDTVSMDHGEPLRVIMIPDDEEQVTTGPVQFSVPDETSVFLRPVIEELPGAPQQASGTDAPQPSGAGPSQPSRSGQMDMPAELCSVLDVGLLPAVTRERLLAGRSFGFPELRDLYHGVYETFRRNNKHSYPKDYREIVHKLMTAFPVIQTCLGLSDTAAQETVLAKLRTKFRNERKKRPGSPTQRPAPKKPKVQQVDGLPNFHPAPTSSHVPAMETEKKLNKLRFDESLEDDERGVLLAETLPARRAAILTKGAKTMSLKRLKEMFPFIFGEEQLWKEMGLLAGEPVKSKYEAKLAAALDCLAKEVGCPRDIAAETLLRLLEEEALVRDDELTKPGPCILVKQGEDDDPVQYQIYLEGVQIARCGCLESALLVLAVGVYIFNQAVRKSNRGLMWLMARGVMGLAAETKPTSRSVDLMGAFGLK